MKINNQYLGMQNLLKYIYYAQLQPFVSEAKIQISVFNLCCFPRIIIYTECQHLQLNILPMLNTSQFFCVMQGTEIISCSMTLMTVSFGMSAIQIPVPIYVMSSLLFKIFQTFINLEIYIHAIIQNIPNQLLIGKYISMLLSEA